MHIEGKIDVKRIGMLLHDHYMYANINHIHWTQCKLTELKIHFYSDKWSQMNIRILIYIKPPISFKNVSKLHDQLQMCFNLHLIACRKYSTPCSYNLNASS